MRGRLRHGRGEDDGLEACGLRSWVLGPGSWVLRLESGTGSRQTRTLEPRTLEPEAYSEETVMTIQGVPDLGPGLRLHLNENTGGCSPKVVEAVRGFTAERLALYPDFTDAIRETAAFLGVDPDRIVLTNGLDEGILLASIAYLVPRAPKALVDARRAGPSAVGHDRDPGGAPDLRALPPRRDRHGRTGRVGAGSAGLLVPGRCDAARRHAQHAHHLREQPEQPDRAADSAGGASAASPARRRMRWCSWTRRITTSWARTSSPRRRRIRT